MSRVLSISTHEAPCRSSLHQLLATWNKKKKRDLIHVFSFIHLFKDIETS